MKNKSTVEFYVPLARRVVSDISQVLCLFCVSCDANDELEEALRETLTAVR
jgi:hypothetical protein